jgi:AraC family transcriptional regulator of adaptative response / DNA-3-methyladenine glycosylase II
MTRVTLPYTPPYNWDLVMAFLAPRAVPGVESVDSGRYRRTVAAGKGHGTIDIGHDPGRLALTVGVDVTGSAVSPALRARLSRMFDVDTNPRDVAEHFDPDPLLGERLRANPGIRVPGAWDPFELAVRAVLGQQVSVAAATTLAGRMAERFGSPIDDAGDLNRLFPTARQLADAAVEGLGVMPARAAAIRALARAVLDGRVDLDAVDTAVMTSALTALPGIGPWTAAYVAMRTCRDRDALPWGDLVLRKVTGASSARDLERLSDAWRPWRSYAVMLLWQSTMPGWPSRRARRWKR